MTAPCPFCNRMVENCCDEMANAVPCEFCGKIIKDCCIERIWDNASKKLGKGTFTQGNMDKLMHQIIEKSGGFQCMKEEDHGNVTELIPIKVDGFQCPKCGKIDTYTKIDQHIQQEHTDKDGVYE